MAVAVELNFKGATLEQYDKVLQKMGFQHRGKGAPKGIFHWVAKTADGIRVVDVWESKEAFEKFSREQIAPYSREAGFPAAPEVRITEVYNYLTAGS